MYVCAYVCMFVCMFEYVKLFLNVCVGNQQYMHTLFTPQIVVLFVFAGCFASR